MKIKCLGHIDSITLLLEIKKQKFSSLFKLAEENDMLALSILHKNIYIPTSTETLQNLYRTDQKELIKTPRAQYFTKAAIGKGLISTDNEEWIKERNKVKGIFSAAHTAGLVQKIDSVISSRIQHATLENEAKSFFNSITIQVIGTLFFGKFSEKDAQQIIVSIDNMIEPTFERIVNPLYFLKSPFSRNINSERNAFLNTIKKCMEYARTEKEENLVQKYYPEGNESESIGNIFAAGYETVSNALTWMFYELGRNKPVVEKLKEEIKRVNIDVSYEEILLQIPYTQACFKEALRLYPPLWLNGRTAEKSISLQNLVISEKSDVLLSPYLFHRLSKYWENPQQYNPDRNLGANSDCYIPFGRGSRACVGERIALLEAYLIIISLYKKFDVEIIFREISPAFHFTLRPVGNINLNLK